MGQAGSHPAAHAPLLPRRAHTLPHTLDPPRNAPKVLPSLTESPRLRSTDNGAILHSGGTISGRRPTSHIPEPTRIPHGHMHNGVYRSRSAGGVGDPNEVRSRERDPLHRSHTNLDMRHHDGGSGKRFGSEPDLRVEEEPPRPRCNNRHFRKKYRAPPPPCHDNRGGSSPDSSDANARAEPQRKLRLFKTRNETKRQNGHVMESRIPQYRGHEHKPIDTNDQTFERRYKSYFKEKEQHCKYPDNNDMVQSSASLKREENILQNQRLDYRKRMDKISNCKAKTKTNDAPDVWNPSLINRDFRHSDRFRKLEPVIPPLRREKTFDAAFISSERDSESPKLVQERSKPKAEAKEIKPSQLSNNKPLRKSLPSLLNNNNEAKDEFRAELKKATNRIRNELVNKVIVSQSKPSQNDKLNVKSTPTKTRPLKVTESSPVTNIKRNNNVGKTNNRRPLTRTNEGKSKLSTNLITNNKLNQLDKENVKVKMPDRGQASGKESTPEHSPTRRKALIIQTKKDEQQTAPSKQFYFGMIEPKQTETKDNLKDFPGLGSPIIEEISNFHLIEKKLLGYHNEDDEFDKFNARLKESYKVKNLSSESALSSDASEGEGSDGSLGIAVRLRPTLPKKQQPLPKFSPTAAWKQLACLDAYLAGTRPLAVETKMNSHQPAESSPRSDQSADKSGDSGISGDHATSDPVTESPTRHQVEPNPDTWTPQQDLEESSSDGASPVSQENLLTRPDGLVTYSARGQPFSLSLPREPQDKGKQIAQGFNSLQKLKKSVSGALGAALGSRRFDLEHEPMLAEPEQNWFLTKSAPNSLSNPLLFQPSRKASAEEDIIKEESPPPSEKEEFSSWRPSIGGSYLSWGGHVMYLPPAPDAPRQPLSMLGPIDRPVRSKSSGELEVAARAARAARGLSSEMRERDRERSASPVCVRALPARVEPGTINEEFSSWRPSIGGSYLSWGGHVMYLPPAPDAPRQPLSMLGPIDRPVRSKSSGELEVAARAARAARGLSSEMRERDRERSASPVCVRALPARVEPGTINRKQPETRKNKRFTFQSTVRQLERRRLAEKLSREADLKEQQRKTELEAMRRVEEEFQRKRAREKANIRQQLRLVSGTASMPPTNNHTKSRDEPDGSAYHEAAQDKVSREGRNGRGHSNASSETSGRSKSTTPVRCVDMSEWRMSNNCARQYRDWGSSGGWTRLTPAHDHPPACAKMPIATTARYNANEVEAFSGSPRSDNYRLEFARGVPRSPRTPRPPRLLTAPRSPSTSGSELSMRQPIKIRETTKEASEGQDKPMIVPTLTSSMPTRATLVTH